MQTIKNWLAAPLTGPAVVIGLSIILLGIFTKSGANNFVEKDNSVSVTGSAERYVTADTAKWTITINRRTEGVDSKQNGEKLTANDINVVKNYLKRNGIDDANITDNPASSYQVCQLSSQGYENCALGVVGYNFSATVIVEDPQVKKIESLSKKIGAEIGNISTSQNIEYYFNGLKDIRVQMLSEATKNARERAEAVADAGDARLGAITSLSSGVFQVLSKNSVDVSDYGSYDTSSIEKKVTATVKATFKIQ